jgi:CRP/FNR family cyclic AMP-dependent transcriptional regulator
MPRMTEINIFKHAPDAELLEAGQLLFSEGDHGDEVMFAVVEGEVELSRNGSVIETVGPGGILGELALIDPAPRTATATARTAARVVRVDKKHFVFLVHEHPTFALQVMTVMAERIRKTNKASTAATPSSE